MDQLLFGISKTVNRSVTLDTTVCLDTSLYKATQQNIQRLHEQPETSQRLWTLSFSRCGTLIAGGIRHGIMGEIRFWDATTLETTNGDSSTYRMSETSDP